MKKLRKLVSILLICAMAIIEVKSIAGEGGLKTEVKVLNESVVPAQDVSAFAKAEEPDPVITETKRSLASVSVPYYFSKPGGGAGDIIASGDIVSLNSQSLVIFVGSDQANGGAPLQKDSQIRFISSNEEVVKVEPYSDADGVDRRAIKLVRVGPGYSQLAAYMPDGNLITLLIKVELAVDKADWRNITLTQQKMLILNVGDTYNVVVKYLNDALGMTVDNALLEWSEDSEVGKIVSVSSAGTIKANGAGLATVTLRTQTYDSSGAYMAENIKVLVVPKGSDAFNSTFTGYTDKINVLKSTSDFQLYTNTTASQNLRWKVYSVENNGSKKLLLTTNNRDLEYKADILDFSISSENNQVSIQNANAGTYKLYAYVFDSDMEYDPTTDWAALEHLEYTVEVGFDIHNRNLVMNVGDTFDIVANSNIPADSISTLFTFSSDASTFASVNTKGVISANAKGEATILIHYDKDNPHALFTAGSLYSSKLSSDIYYNVSVIDGIALNVTSLSLYTGSTYMLEATATDRNTTIKWYSSNPSVVSVENGEIKALTAGYSVITAQQIIGGVVKTASCTVTVQPSVTEIKLTPSDISLGIGDSKTVVASLTPQNITGVSLKWMSSDEKIFKIDETTSLTATITAVSGGTAVLTAINSENVVVGYASVKVNQPAAGIKLSDTELSLRLAQKQYQLYATITPDNTTDISVEWKSTDETVVTVDANGRLTLKKPGKTSIIARSKDNPSLMAVCNVTVLSEVGGVKFDETAIEIYVGETKRLTYQITPVSASNKTVSFEVINQSICQIDSTGLLTAKAAGTTQVFIWTQDGNHKSMCTVVVKQRATGVKMSVSNLVINKGEYFNIEVSVTPATATEASLTWESQDPSIATVTSKGRVTAKKAGSTIIIVKTTTGATAYCTVTVMEGVVKVNLDPQDALMDVGDTLTITPVFTPKTATNTAVKWFSSNESVATVNDLGVVKALQGGLAIIYCETEDGGYKDFCTVNVHEPILSIELDKEFYRLGLGKFVQLTATLKNDDTASDKEIIWSSEDENVAIVDKYGKVTAVALGRTKIYVRAAEGDAEAYCEIEVVKEVTQIKLDVSTLTLLVGEQYTFTATVNPDDATYKTPVFSSQDPSVAMIDEDGVIAALKPGTTMVVASAADNSGKYAQCYVTVINPIPATGLTVSDSEITMIAGETKNIIVSKKPVNSTDGLTWTSNNIGIAKVDQEGNITAVTTGNAVITVMADSGKKATVEVTVLGLTETNLTMPVYSQYSRLRVLGSDSTVYWYVDDNSICKVTNGTVIAYHLGTTTIHAIVDGRTLDCTITVINGN